MVVARVAAKVGAMLRNLQQRQMLSWLSKVVTAWERHQKVGQALDQEMATATELKRVSAHAREVVEKLEEANSMVSHTQKRCNEIEDKLQRVEEAGQLAEDWHIATCTKLKHAMAHIAQLEDMVAQTRLEAAERLAGAMGEAEEGMRAIALKEQATRLQCSELEAKLQQAHHTAKRNRAANVLSALEAQMRVHRQGTGLRQVRLIVGHMVMGGLGAKLELWRQQVARAAETKVASYHNPTPPSCMPLM